MWSVSSIIFTINVIMTANGNNTPISNAREGFSALISHPRAYAPAPRHQSAPFPLPQQYQHPSYHSNAALLRNYPPSVWYAHTAVYPSTLHPALAPFPSTNRGRANVISYSKLLRALKYTVNTSVAETCTLSSESMNTSDDGIDSINLNQTLLLAAISEEDANYIEQSDKSTLSKQDTFEAIGINSSNGNDSNISNKGNWLSQLKPGATKFYS